MKETLTEYGVEIDAQQMIEPADPEILELEAKHPGEHDKAYLERRHQLFNLCRQDRRDNLGSPLIEYNAGETRIWREVCPILDELHIKHASSIYLKAKRELKISEDQIPQLRHLSEKVKKVTNMHLVP